MLLLHLIAGLFLGQPVPATPAPWTLAPAALEVHSHALPAAGTIVAPAPAVSGTARGTGTLQRHVPGSSSSAGAAGNDTLHRHQIPAGAASDGPRAPRHGRRSGGPLHGGRTPHSYGNPPPPPLTT